MGDTPSGIEGAAPERHCINHRSTDFALSGNACGSTPAARARRSATSSGCASGTRMTWVSVSSWCISFTVDRLLTCTPGSHAD